MSLSISKREWKFPLDVQVDPKLVEASLGYPFLAKLLVKRGINTSADIKTFLNPDEYSPTDPGELPGVMVAVERVEKAIKSGEHVTVYGDYDVDGVTGTSVLLSVLQELGANVDFYIPNRIDEGYGLNLKAVSVLASKRRTKLIISCDCGVSNFAEINFARSLGVDTIVCDHHTMPDMLPPAVAIVHPKFLAEDHSLYHLPGVGVAYKLCQALLSKFDKLSEADKLLDLVTLGMIADMVPLVKENRYLVQIGLTKLVQSERPGIQALLEQVTGQSGTELVGFGIAPRINAVGRLSDAQMAVRLLTTKDAIEAGEVARQLQLENTRRQELCEKIFLEADHMVASTINVENDAVIFVYKEDWHHGVVGIVASRLLEKYNCPVFVGQLNLEDGIIKGSARGIEVIDLYQVLKANEHLLLKWGGHKAAAGFSLEQGKADAFKQGLQATCNTMLSGQNRRRVLEIDEKVEAKDVNIDLCNVIEKLAPFGMANKKPVLVMHNLSCTSSRLLGKEGKHSRFLLKDNVSGAQFEALLWNSRNKIPKDNETIDVAFAPEINRFNGSERLQLVLVDWRSEASISASHEVKEVKKSEVALAKQNIAAPQAVASPGDSPILVAPNDSPQVAIPTDLPVSGKPALGTNRTIASVKISFKDLRHYESGEQVLAAAVRKLGSKLIVFGETCPQVPNVSLVDRTYLPDSSAKSASPLSNKLMIWQYPPSLLVFQNILQKFGAEDVFLVGGFRGDAEEPSSFIRKLMGLVRFAVSKRDGKAEGDKVASALGTSKMCVALGLTLLRKLQVIDWYSEDGHIYLDLLGEPQGNFEDQSEYRHLAASLKEVNEFRLWLSESPLKDIQLALMPNQVRMSQPVKPSRRTDEFPAEPSKRKPETIPAFKE